MNKPVLVIMAAGMGSRYGGLKQIDPIDEDGQITGFYTHLRAHETPEHLVCRLLVEKKKKRNVLYGCFTCV